jgi:hypothetical protein
MHKRLMALVVRSCCGLFSQAERRDWRALKISRWVIRWVVSCPNKQDDIRCKAALGQRRE